jgi:hypothetical protein
MLGIARELTKRKMPTPNGDRWHPETVDRAVERLVTLTTAGGAK